MSDVVPLRQPDRGPAARREQVRRRVLAEGFARIDDLAREFDVSLMTMHRDLDGLAAEGWLTKIRGAATANPSALLEAGVRERSAALRNEKVAIAEVAANSLRQGQTIFLDDSTTALALVPYLVAHAPITVASNFVPVLTALADVPEVELHVLGGQYFRTQEACFGMQTVDAIAQLRADVFFMSTTAVNHGSCYHRSEWTVMVRKAFMAAAARSILLVDHAKFGRTAPHLMCSLDKFDTVITDAGIDPEDLRALRIVNHDVIVADVD